LNTAPASACVWDGNSSETASRPMVNMMSHDRGESSCAGKAAYQYGQCDETTAMRSGAPELSRRATRTRMYGLVRWMRRPVVS
jgi:hypothetical protein